MHKSYIKRFSKTCRLRKFFLRNFAKDTFAPSTKWKQIPLLNFLSKRFKVNSSKDFCRVLCYELRIFFFKIEVFNLAFYTVFIHLFPIVLNIYSNHKKRKLQGLHVCACEHIFPTFFFSCLEIIYAWNRKEAIGEIVERVLQCHS